MPENSDTPESGFEYPENNLIDAAIIMYDGFIEYMKTFLTNKVDPAVVKECKTKIADMNKELDGFSTQEPEVDPNEEDFEYSY